MPKYVELTQYHNGSSHSIGTVSVISVQVRLSHLVQGVMRASPLQSCSSYVYTRQFVRSCNHDDRPTSWSLTSWRFVPNMLFVTLSVLTYHILYQNFFLLFQNEVVIFRNNAYHNQFHIMFAKLYAKLSAIVAFAASTCMIVGIVTPCWLSTNGRYQGLWIYCYYMTHADGKRQCLKMESRPGKSLRYIIHIAVKPYYKGLLTICNEGSYLQLTFQSIFHKAFNLFQLDCEITLEASQKVHVTTSVHVTTYCQHPNTFTSVRCDIL